MERGWSPSPGARNATAFELPPVEPGRVVGLGAICDLEAGGSRGSKEQSFRVGEFVTLEDGRRVLLHEDRGFTAGLRSADPGDLRTHETLESLTEAVLTTVLPDEDGMEAHPWAFLAALARSRGLEVTAGDLRALRYEVVFTENVRRWLTPDV